MKELMQQLNMKILNNITWEKLHQILPVDISKILQQKHKSKHLFNYQLMIYH